MKHFETTRGCEPARSLIVFPLRFPGVQASSVSAFDVKMTKLGFLRLSYEKQDTLLKLLILSMAAVLCKSASCCAGLADACWCPRRGTPGWSRPCSFFSSSIDCEALVFLK